MTVRRDESTETDASGAPIYGDPAPVLEDVPVRFRSGGSQYERQETGELVQHAPSLLARGRLATQIEEGDEVELTPVDPDGIAYDGLEVQSVRTHYGARTASVGSTELEVA